MKWLYSITDSMDMKLSKLLRDSEGQTAVPAVLQPMRSKRSDIF